MRAGFGALSDKSLPSLLADAEGEVAAAFKGILKILTGNLAGWRKSWRDWHYQSTLRKRRLARVWQGKAFGRQASDGRVKSLKRRGRSEIPQRALRKPSSGIPTGCGERGTGLSRRWQRRAILRRPSDALGL